MAAISWTIRHYTLGGALVAELPNATDRHMKAVLNGLDEASFTLYLDDATAPAINRLSSVIKIWRTVNDPIYGSSYSSTAPEFSGIVTGTTKNGELNTMQVNCYGALWRLQSKFHILNHYLVLDPQTGSPWRQGRLMWYHIQLINGAFGAASHTGIYPGSFSATDPVMAPYFLPKGSNTWSVLFDQLMRREGSPDLRITPTHSDGSNSLCTFGTVEKLGDDRSGSVRFQYHTGAHNVNDMTEQIIVSPGQFGNYMWVSGQGGPNSGKIAMEFDSGSGNGYGGIGLYMVHKNTELQKLSALRDMAPDEFELIRTPTETYDVTLSPAVPPYYRSNFNLGDLVSLDASKGAMNFSGVKRRIYEVDMQISDNNMETCKVLLAKDFFGKVGG